MFEVIDARLDDRPFRGRLDAVAAEIGASRWVLLWRDGPTWQRLGTPGTRDPLLATVAERRPGCLDQVAADRLDPEGPRLRSAGLGTVSALTLDPERPAVVFFEEPTHSLADRGEPVRWFGAALETAMATAGAVDLASWVPDVAALASGTLPTDEALPHLAESFGLHAVLVAQPTARGVSVRTVDPSGTVADHEQVPNELDWSSIVTEPASVIPWLPTARVEPGWTAVAVAAEGGLVLAAASSGPPCDHLQTVADLLGHGLDRGRSVDAAREHVRMAERTRLATTLHEELSQQLATLSVEIDLLTSRPESDGVTDDLAQLRRGVVDALESLRSAIFELTPPEPDWTRLEDGLERFVRDHAAARGLGVDYVVTGEARPTDPEVVSLVFATVQEAISNVAKHAETSDVCVRVAFGADDLVVAVEDAGVGVGVDLDRADRTHQGLGVMHTRARLAGAKLEVESEVGTGTTVRLTVPVTLGEEVLP